ncbi:hypothetical protein [Peribacillus simplex]|nr:hypothetical protein [Peribacillus simplex]WHY56097.1 hypothetical protein QNH43_23675 [Peribacillus simplex]
MTQLKGSLPAFYFIKKTFQVISESAPISPTVCQATSPVMVIITSTRS